MDVYNRSSIQYILLSPKLMHIFYINQECFIHYVGEGDNTRVGKVYLANRMFYEICREDGISKLRTLILYAGVRCRTWRAQRRGYKSKNISFSEADKMLFRSKEARKKRKRFLRIIDDVKRVSFSSDEKSEKGLMIY